MTVVTSRVADMRRCQSESYHRIELEPGVDCWTILNEKPKAE